MTRPAMILAAGFGTRMGALTRDRPKPLIHVGGRPLIDHAIAAAGPAAPVVVNGHYRAAQLEADLKTRHPGVLFSHETPEILESGGAIKQALPVLGADPILTLNADAVWRGPNPHHVLADRWAAQEMEALLLLVPRQQAIGRDGGGDFDMDDTGRLVLNKGPDTWVYTGAQILNTARIARSSDRVFSLRDVWRDMTEAGTLFGCVYPGAWGDVGHPGGIQAAEDMLRDV